MRLYSSSFGCNLTRGYLHNEHNPSLRDFMAERKTELEKGESRNDSKRGDARNKS